MSMTKKKPNYTQFMRRPAPLEMSPPSNADDTRARVSSPMRREATPEPEIPWGEIIVEFGPDDAVPLGLEKTNSSPVVRPAAEPVPAVPDPPAPTASTARPAHAPVDDVIIEGIPVFPEPVPAEAPFLRPEMVEWAFPGPGAPPLVFMAIAIVLLLCLL